MDNVSKYLWEGRIPGMTLICFSINFFFFVLIQGSFEETYLICLWNTIKNLIKADIDFE